MAVGDVEAGETQRTPAHPGAGVQTQGQPEAGAGPSPLRQPCLRGQPVADGEGAPVPRVQGPAEKGRDHLVKGNKLGISL